MLTVDRSSTPRSLLFFVIRDHIGVTPLSALQNTLIQDLQKIWSSISKPEGLEQSRIEDYFDFGFAALPHKILQGEKFESEVAQLGARFTTGHRVAKGGDGGVAETEGGILLPEYHRRIPADGLSVYAEGIWDQIVNNKDLDLPTQQELLAQFRCDEISREVLVAFDQQLTPLEEKQTQASKLGKAVVLPDLGSIASEAREKCFKAFEVQASRYHKGVYARKKQELESKVDGRLKTLYQGQIAAAHKAGVAAFSEAVANKVKAGQKAGGGYEFAEIVSNEKKKTMDIFKAEVDSLAIEGVEWTNFAAQNQLFEAELDEVSSKLRKDEIRRLATRVERWVKSRLGDAVGLEFNKLGTGRGGSGAPEEGEKPASEKDLWDRIWNVFTGVVSEAEARFSDRAKSFDASDAEVEVGLWRLRRKSWTALREKIEEEVMEGNILMKLRENFEDKFRYDEAGVPRIWRPTDDIEGIYTRARESTLTLIPLLAKFKLLSSQAPPDLIGFIGPQPSGVEAGDEEDLAPIGGVDEEEGKSLEEEMTMLSENKRQDLVVRFKKTADGVYVEAKRSAIGGMTQVPWYFYVLLLVLGWNEIWMGKIFEEFLVWNLANCCSFAQSVHVHPSHPAGWRHLHCVVPQPPGPHDANGQRGRWPGLGHCQAAAARLRRQLRHGTTGAGHAGEARQRHQHGHAGQPRAPKDDGTSEPARRHLNQADRRTKKGARNQPLCTKYSKTMSDMKSQAAYSIDERTGYE